MLRNLNHFLYQGCEQHGFTFIDNAAIKHNNLWNDGVHLLESGKIIITDNLIQNIYHFLQTANQYGNSNSRNCPDTKPSGESIKNESSNSLFQIKKCKQGH